MTAQQDVIKAAMAIAKDAAEGKVDPATLDAQLAAKCRELFGAVVGPDDPLWPLHVDVARAVLAAGGIPADELSEWLAVAKNRAEGETSC